MCAGEELYNALRRFISAMLFIINQLQVPRTIPKWLIVLYCGCVLLRLIIDSDSLVGENPNIRVLPPRFGSCEVR